MEKPTLRWENEVAKYTLKKERNMRDRGRCMKCWHNKIENCICDMIKPLCFTKNVKFFVYIHYSEWFNAGDDAKLLTLASPSNTSLFVYGKPGDDDRFQKAIQEGGGSDNAVILFPSDSAITVAEYFQSRNNALDPAAHLNSSDLSNNVGNEGGYPLKIIVIDSTWRRARKMQHHLKRLVGEVKHVKLETDTVSVYARTQSEQGRICSIEAVALMLQEIGEEKKVCQSLIEYVKINNRALDKEFSKKDTRNWKWDPIAADKGINGTLYGHPAWYFATFANGTRKPSW